MTETARLPHHTNIICIEVFFDSVPYRWRYNLIVNTARVLVDAKGQPVIEPRVVAAGVELTNMGPAASPWDVLSMVCAEEGVRLPIAVRHVVIVFETHVVHNFSVEHQGRPS